MRSGAGTGVVRCGSVGRIGASSALILLHDGFHIEQIFVQTHFQHATDGVFRLSDAIANGAANAKLAHAHIAVAAREDLERRALACVADEILIAGVAGPDVAALDVRGVPAAAPRTLAPIAGSTRVVACVLIRLCRSPRSFRHALSLVVGGVDAARSRSGTDVLQVYVAVRWSVTARAHPVLAISEASERSADVGAPCAVYP